MPFQLSSGTLAVDVLDPNDATDMDKMVDPVTSRVANSGGPGGPPGPLTCWPDGDSIY